MLTRSDSKSGRGSRTILLVLFLLIAVIFSATRMHLPEQSIICGQDVSNMLVTDVLDLLEDKVNNYAIEVTVEDQVFKINAVDIDLVVLKDDFKDVVAAAIKDGNDVDPWSVMSLDQNKLRSFVSKNFDQKQTEFVPATVAWDDSDGHFKVIEGAAETWYDAEKLAEVIRNGVANLKENLDVPEEVLYTERDNTKQYAAAEALAMRANELTQLELEYVFNPRNVEIGRYVLDRNMIASFLRVDTVTEAIDVDRDAILTFVESISNDYRYFKKEDRFVTHDGDRVDIKIPIQEQTVDTQSLVDLISENILGGISDTFEVPYSGELNFDGSYVEVSIPQQHLWVYKDGEIVLDSDIVSGNRGAGKRSPTGLYCIRGHLRDIYLMRAYFVNYWMTITLGGRYGFHDADGWRTPEEYGGDTYKTNGSGGCINVPGEKIAIMYDLVPDLTPVVIYNEFYYD